MLPKITFSSDVAPQLIELLGLDVGPKKFGGVVNGKVFGNDICSIIEMSDEIDKLERGKYANKRND